MLSRRSALGWMATVAFSMQTNPTLSITPMQRRFIPGTKTALPVIGLGTWQAFDFKPSIDPNAKNQALESLRSLARWTNALIDTSPMYGHAEATLGALLKDTAGSSKLLLASKIWTQGKASGERQLEQTLQYLGRTSIDLMQIHNLLDADTHWKTLQTAKQTQRVKYLGVSHYTAAAHGELQQWIKREGIDFVQVNLSLAEPQAALRVLPFAAEHGVAVLINRPFAEGAMFERVRGKPLPAFAAELGCESHAQLFLKWILSQPAVTCVLTGTRNPKHLADNMAAGYGSALNIAQRQQIERWWNGL